MAAADAMVLQLAHNQSADFRQLLTGNRQLNLLYYG